MTKSNEKSLQKSPATVMNNLLSGTSMQEMIKGALQDGADIFVASLVELYGSDSYLQKCEPGDVVKEAMKAAAMKLPIARSLGFAWIVPYWSKRLQKLVPTFMPGWKGIIQLAQRSSQYRYINCGVVYEGELKQCDKLTGALDISGAKASDKVIGYFGYFQLLNGFSKASFWTVEEVRAHVLKYNQESKKEKKIVGNWAEHFDERAMANVLKHLIMKFGIMSVDMQKAIPAGAENPEETAQNEINANANTEEIGFTEISGNGVPEGVNPQTGEVTEAADEPGY
ncbi:recombinase RecT [Prosthecochloris sp.]|uniref:recombinase RecT n=1 Tax=Prosthecochloris sp. TaxID=290513 RepID=UPI00257D0121|nr:recombinase RecT [Prosthecochloris sp.]